MDLAERWQERLPPFSKLLGMRLRSVTRERVLGELEVRRDLGNVNGIAHGGALMAFADTLGALGAVANLPPGATTTTLESKTNFFAPALVGSVVVGESEPLHLGRSTMVWQTRIRDGDGKLLVQVTQTQMVLLPRPASRPAESGPGAT